MDRIRNNGEPPVVRNDYVEVDRLDLNPVRVVIDIRGNQPQREVLLEDGDGDAIMVDENGDGNDNDINMVDENGRKIVYNRNPDVNPAPVVAVAAVNIFAQRR